MLTKYKNWKSTKTGSHGTCSLLKNQFRSYLFQYFVKRLLYVETIAAFLLSTETLKLSESWRKEYKSKNLVYVKLKRIQTDDTGERDFLDISWVWKRIDKIVN